MQDVMVGDEVLIRGTAMQVKPGVGVLVGLSSKTDQYEEWVRLEDVVEVRLPNPPPEPSNGTWLLGDADSEGRSSVFHRNDAEGHCDRARRFDRRWWDFAASEWVDWPTAAKRGANPARRLVEAP